MGMVKSVEILQDASGHRARVTLRITSPGCHLQMWFTERVTDEIAGLPEIAGVDVLWSDVFDWSDDDMSDSLKLRLRAKKKAALVAHHRSLS
jgi:metal-sulfur cluster biosynthetic enzyme